MPAPEEAVVDLFACAVQNGDIGIQILTCPVSLYGSYATVERIFCNGIQVGGGRTAGPLQDMNDALSFLLEKGHTYTFAYENSRGEKTTVEVLVGNDPMTVKGYMQ